MVGGWHDSRLTPRRPSGRPRVHQIVVTHGGTLAFVVAHWIGMPIQSLGQVNFRVSPGSITTVREDDYFHSRQVVSLGDTRHLEH